MSSNRARASGSSCEGTAGDSEQERINISTAPQYLEKQSFYV